LKRCDGGLCVEMLKQSGSSHSSANSPGKVELEIKLDNKPVQLKEPCKTKPEPAGTKKGATAKETID